MNNLIRLKNNKNKLLPLGITVQTKTKHIHPQIPSLGVSVLYPGIKKKVVKVKHLKSGEIDITWRIKPPRLQKSKRKQTVNKNKSENFGECTKRMIRNLANSSNKNNTTKIKEIKEKCKLY